MHVPLRYTEAKSLPLTCLKTPPPAGGFAMIGCRLSRERILTFASLTESSNSIFNPLYVSHNGTCICFVVVVVVFD